MCYRSIDKHRTAGITHRRSVKPPVSDASWEKTRITKSHSDNLTGCSYKEKWRSEQIRFGGVGWRLNFSQPGQLDGASDLYAPHINGYHLTHLGKKKKRWTNKLELDQNFRYN